MKQPEVELRLRTSAVQHQHNATLNSEQEYAMSNLNDDFIFFGELAFSGGDGDTRINIRRPSSTFLF